MNRVKVLLISILGSMIFYGCASQIMVPASQPEAVDNDKALVTFIMLSNYLTNSGSYGASITPIEYDLWDGGTFIGALSKDTSIQLAADQGDHLFIARGGNWSFVKADLRPGRKYYLFLNVYPRFWGPHGVYLQPVKAEDKELLADLPSYLKGIIPMSVHPGKRDAYVSARIEAVKNEIDVFKANAEYGHTTLAPEDGR